MILTWAFKQEGFSNTFLGMSDTCVGMHYVVEHPLAFKVCNQGFQEDNCLFIKQICIVLEPYIMQNPIHSLSWHCTGVSTSLFVSI